MVTIGMNYKIIPGKEEVFENAFKSVIKVMNEMEGHTQSNLYKDVNDSHSYLIVSDWNSEEAYKLLSIPINLPGSWTGGRKTFWPGGPVTPCIGNNRKFGSRG